VAVAAEQGAVSMTWVVGTDEAGYGPNLGPLVISATMWHVPATRPLDSLPAHFAALRIDAGDDADLLIADSKKLYTPGGGLAALERGVLATLRLIDGPAHGCETWQTLLARLDPDRICTLADMPWHATYDCALPVHAEAGAIALACARCTAALAMADVCLTGMRSRVVFPAEFNARVAACGSKGTALSLWTLELVRDLIAPLGEAAILVQCDKHGGRNRYAALLQHVFAASWVDVCEESRAQSVYRWGPPAQRVEARFAVRGERFLPSALASMTSKYVRELAMLAFNEFWRVHLPGLQPTAGYPLDATRFQAQIRDVQQQLGIPDAVLWRTR
jgi:hypothetical protein